VSFQAQDRAQTRRMPKLSALALAAGVLALAGCGSSSSTTSSSATPTATTPTTSTTSSTPAAAAAAGSVTATQILALAANPEGQLKYNKTALTARAGNIAIAFTNTAPLGHNVTIESSSGQVVGATPTFQGGAKTLKLTLKAGTYKFFCSVPGHRMAGMEGTLTVQ
jgi:plastocyanin